MYEAIVCRLSNVRPHSNADRLKCATANGCNVIVGANHEDGELGILFPEGGCLSSDFCVRQKLYRKHPETGEVLGGYLDENARVRALKLRGEISDGLWLPLDDVGLDVCDIGNVDRLFEGLTIGEPLCEKYMTPATRRALAAGGAQSKKARAAQALERHYDTPQLRDIKHLPLCDTVVITEKVHGTSGRTGLVLVEEPRPWWRRLLGLRAKKRYQHVSGTRNCILDTGAPGEKGEVYRQLVHDSIAPHLEPDEIWFYEIAGFDTNGTPIMAPHFVGAIGDTKTEKALRKEYGDGPILYRYGCQRTEPSHRVFVYRITLDGRELPFDEVRARAHAAGFDTPVVLAYMHDPESIEAVRTLATELTRGPSFYDSTHPREGVCVRFEDSDSGVVSKAVKHKSFVFCALEGIARNDPEYVDAEEVA